MMSDKRYFFIINPKSGNGKGPQLVPQIESACKKRKISFSIYTTQAPKEGIAIASKAIVEGFHVIVAVGGDGTVNEIASSVHNTAAELGIIPIGSGNGLAREMGIPLAPKNAIRNLFEGSSIKIDTGKCNGHFFACTAGIGFDAHLAHQFLSLQNRGLWGYVRLFSKEYFVYQEQQYELITPEKTMISKAFLITIANCRQWGNEFYISPTSKPNDGVFEICLIRKFPLIALPILLYRCITKTLHRSRYVLIIRSSQLKISNQSGRYFHRDGETLSCENDLEISLLPRSMAIISGK